MTNKPMLSVERELLEKLVEEGRVSEISDDEWKELRALLDKPAPEHQGEPVAFQSRVQPWMMACFGEAIAADRQERNHRFLEEALELMQANQCTASEARQLVDYVYGRPVGEPSQEVGGVMVTLAALCLAHGMDMHVAGETELARIWTKVEQVRAKQAAKPAMSPLPGTYPDREQPAPVAVVVPENLLSHRNTWLKAMERLVALEAELEAEAGQSAQDSNDPSYWEHELKAMRAMYADLDRLDGVNS